MYHKKHFSLEEARKLLPDLKIKLKKITGLKKSLDEQGFNIHTHGYFGGIGTNGTGKYPEELEMLVELVREISNDGIILKGIDEGLIDFPFVRENGDEVYLCYLLGESDIEYWHGIEDGFAGRRDIGEL